MHVYRYLGLWISDLRAKRTPMELLSPFVFARYQFSYPRSDSSQANETHKKDLLKLFTGQQKKIEKLGLKVQYRNSMFIAVLTFFSKNLLANLFL